MSCSLVRKERIKQDALREWVKDLETDCAAAYVWLSKGIAGIKAKSYADAKIDLGNAARSIEGVTASWIARTKRAKSKT